ncbi:hypothetical protein [Chelativorans sp. M5D2P16]|uniref:hypothetical protein n=1 Tax=Chelativorans sp. M5D2P16 TaxID=3095678 RepID=UPI002ACA24C8|nr:hypothetical protein [Chelativorans sp. M5D2P16]MDZ5697633.1 hypothetical protein [Chelativorans sp. M5D2P16]
MKLPADDSARTTFDVIGDMEAPLHRAADLSLALLRIGAEIDDDDSAIVCTLVALVLENCRAAQRLRGDAFKLTHPRREHFEKAGWPGERAA